MSNTTAAHRDTHHWRRSFWALLGVAIVGLGSATLRVAGVGVDPYTAANIGISNTIGLDLGMYQLISNLVLFVPVLLIGRRYIGVGTVINMVMTGYFIQWFTTLLEQVVPDPPGPVLQTAMFAAGIALFAFGASMYMTAGLGNAPYDAIAPIIVDRSPAPYRVVRMTQDLVFLGLAVVFHGDIGVGTVVTAFFAGPLIEFFTEKVNKPLLRRDLDTLAAWEKRIAMGRSHF